MARRMNRRSDRARLCWGANLPVRFWNCHGGSARMVPNRFAARDGEQVNVGRVVSGGEHMGILSQSSWLGKFLARYSPTTLFQSEIYI